MSQRPDVPQFTWETVPVENGYSNVKVIWLPNLNGNPGSHFFVKNRLKGETISLMTDPEFQSNTIEVCVFIVTAIVCRKFDLIKL